MVRRLCLLVALGLVVAPSAAPSGADRPPPHLRLAWISEISTLSVDTGKGPTVIDELVWPDGRACHSGGCTGGSFGAAAWSPDGRRLAYWIYASPRGRVLDVDTVAGRVYSVKSTWTDGNRAGVDFIRHLATHPGAILGPVRGHDAPLASSQPPAADAPTWSPNGRLLAYVTERGDVRIVPVKGGSPRTIAAHVLGERSPASLRVLFSPDGRRLAIVGWDAGAWVASVHDGRLQRVATEGVRAVDLAWAPDSRHVAFMRGDRRGNGQIVVADLAGGPLVPLTADAPRDAFAHVIERDPAWSPDGRWVAFLSNRDGAHDEELFVIAADGRDERRLTRGLAIGPAPAWSPDSRMLVVRPAQIPTRFVLVDRASARRRTVMPMPATDWEAAVAIGWSAPPPRVDRVPLPARVSAHPIDAVRDHARVGRAHVAGRRLVGILRDTDETGGVSRDGRLVALRRVLDTHHVAVGVVVLASGAKRFLRHLRTSDAWSSRVGFARGSLLLETPEHRVVVPLRPGGRLRILPLATRFAAPTGRATLAALAGGTLLRDRLGRTHRIGGGLLPSADSWSPNGRLFVLLRRLDSVGRADVVLFRSDGRRIGSLLGVREDDASGFRISWSTDGRFLLVTPGYYGTRPPPSPLYAYSVADGRMRRVAGGPGYAFAGPHGVLAYSQMGKRSPYLRTARLVLGAP
jgi:Tol biopolymer transport system component